MSSEGTPGGAELDEAIRALALDLRRNITGVQGGVGTFSDHALLACVAQLEQLGAARPWDEGLAELVANVEHLRDGFDRLRRIAARRAQGRFVSYGDRVRSPVQGLHGASDVGYFEMVASQGVTECVQWKGMPLFKSVYELGLYPMLLWDVRPRTILELGSGAGASAVWLADVSAACGLDARVYSVDLVPPAMAHERVQFSRGDCNSVDTLFDPVLLDSAPHPWLVIEDAHVNVLEVLRHLHRHLTTGDYLVVEDSGHKRDVLAQFLDETADVYAVDTRYTDFFGRNATCAADAILRRQA